MAPLFPEEQVAITKAVEKRRREFTAGRTTARKALAFFAQENNPLPRTEQGETTWPVGYVGSISHTNTWCLAAVASNNNLKSIGLDIEQTSRMKPEVEKKILHPDEQTQVEHLPHTLAQSATLYFTAKEAIYKTLFPIVKEYIGFQQVQLVFAPDQAHYTFNVKPHHTNPTVNQFLRKIHGKAALCNDFSVATAWIKA